MSTSYFQQDFQTNCCAQNWVTKPGQVSPERRRIFPDPRIDSGRSPIDIVESLQQEASRLSSGRVHHAKVLKWATAWPRYTQSQHRTDACDLVFPSIDFLAFQFSNASVSFYPAGKPKSDVVVQVKLGRESEAAARAPNPLDRGGGLFAINSDDLSVLGWNFPGKLIGHAVELFQVSEYLEVIRVIPGKN